ncbi:MAG: HD domain-containing protein [Patescibacteria group bacterium]|nr:HD domain-containing protein [Patescibacteria group bacterium]
MKNIYVTDLREGISLFDENFVVKSIKRMMTKQEKPYLDLELSDRTGNIRGKVWPDNLDKCAEVKEGEVVSIDALVENYNGALQLKIMALKIENNFNQADYQPVSKKDKQEMLTVITSSIRRIKNKHLKSLLDNIFTADFLKDFSEASASYRLHHAYRSGLLEHTSEMLTLSDAILSQYPKMNSDLLTTGVLLHDIGKIVEYKTSTTITITTEGKLLGHIFIGASHIKEKAPKDIPEDLLNEVLHLVLSHHGSLEFGSPILPKTSEALALSSIDDTSAKINSSYIAIHDSGEDAEFTTYYRHLGTELYRSPYLDNLTNEDIPF